MNLSQKDLRSFITPLQMRMDFWIAHSIVKKVYCSRMAVNSLCPEDCQQCKPALVKAFNLELANNPAALLTWNLKNQALFAQENVFEKKTEVKENLFPTSEINPFEALLELL